MDTQEEILRKAAEYVRMTQPRLDAYDAQHAEFVKGASETAKVLADNGLIARESIETFCKKVAEDPSSICGFMSKLAESVTADPLGSGAPAEIKSAAASENDPWVARFFPELRSGNGQVTD